MGTIVRKAEFDDIPWIISMLRDQDAVYSESNGLKFGLFGDAEHVKWLLNSIMEDHILLTAKRDGRSLGFIAGWLDPHPYNPKIRCATHLVWWVSPDVRGGRAGVMLLKTFTDQARKMGADRVILTLAKDTNMKDSTLRRWGYEPSDRSFVMEV